MLNDGKRMLIETGIYNNLFDSALYYLPHLRCDGKREPTGPNTSIVKYIPFR